MSDCHLESVLGSGEICTRNNAKDVHNPRKSKVVIDPRERIGQAMRGLKGEILSDEQRAYRSKVWKRAIIGDKFIYDTHTRR